MPPPRRAQTEPSAPRPAPAPAADALIAIAPAVTRWIERLLAQHDPALSLAQYLALRSISESELDAATLARQTGVSGPAVSQLLALLDEAGLIQRRPAPSDRRRHSLELTAGGRQVFTSARRLLRRRLTSLLAGLKPHEAQAVADLLPVVEAAISGQPPPRRPPPLPPKPPRPPRPV